MAKNPNASLPNRNTLYLGESGAGKSQALKQNEEVPNRGVAMVLYDPNEDHKAHRYRTKAEFGKAVVAALKSKKGFRIAYCGGFGEKDHEWYSAFVFSILDGNRLIYCVDEELGAAGERTGAAAPHHARLMNQGRKYGLVYHGVVQFPTEVPKTVYRNCPIKFVGRLEPEAAEKVSKLIGVHWREIVDQVDLQFWRKDPAKGREAKQIQLKYKKI